MISANTNWFVSAGEVQESGFVDQCRSINCGFRPHQGAICQVPYWVVDKRMWSVKCVLATLVDEILGLVVDSHIGRLQPRLITVSCKVFLESLRLTDFRNRSFLCIMCCVSKNNCIFGQKWGIGRSTLLASWKYVRDVLRSVHYWRGRFGLGVS